MTRSAHHEKAFEFLPPATKFIALPDGFGLLRGGALSGARVGYESWGHLNDRGDNAILILGGLSASAHAASNPDDPSAGWWEDMIGPGRVLDTSEWCVICVTSVGGCFGSTGPGSINAATDRRYGLTFPDVSIEDLADAAAFVVRSLGIDELGCVIGTSMGGMSALSLLKRHPDIARSHINICGAARATPFAIALRSLQRRAVLDDPHWNGGKYAAIDAPSNGMGLARMLGTLSYRSSDEWEFRFGRDRTPAAQRSVEGETSSFEPEFVVETYLQYQADRFIGKYDPNCYLYLSRAIDRFNLACSEKPDLADAFSGMGLGRALVIGASSDMLFPIHQQREIASGLADAGISTQLVVVDTIQGHDAFLTDTTLFAPAMRRFLNEVRVAPALMETSSETFQLPKLRLGAR